MKRSLFALWLSFLLGTTFAQTGTIEGTVTGPDGDALIQVNIIVDVSKGQATTTDFDGRYRLTLPAGDYFVLYRYIGMEDQVIEINVPDGGVVEQDVVMEERAEIMDMVVVSASKYEKKLSEETVSMEVVRSDLLENNNINDAQEGISKVPGVTVTSDNGQANIRGGSGWSFGAGSRVMILYDDLPLLSADAGDAKWGLVPMENLATMEVIKGAASSIYGSGALNGVINFRTAWPTSEPETKFNIWNGFVHSPRNKNQAWWYETNELPFDMGFNFAHSQRFGHTDFVWHGQYDQGRSHFQNGSFGSARVGQKFRFRPKKLERVSMGVNINAYRSWGSNFFVWNGLDSLARVPLTGSDSKSQSTRIIIDPFISYFDEKGNNLHFKARYFNAKNQAGDLGSVPVNYYGELQYNRYFQRAKFNIVAGLTGFADVVRPENPELGSLAGDNRRFNVAPYVQMEKKLFGDRLNLTAGMRYEWFKTTSKDTAIVRTSDLKRPLFRFGANFKAAEYTFVRASFGEGYRFPNIAEQFVNLSIGPIGVVPNPQLQDEQGYYGEVGIKQGFRIGENWQGYTDLSLFAMYYDDMVEANFGRFDNPNSQFFGLAFSFQNVGQTLIAGTEVTLVGEGKIGRFPFQILSGYTFVEPRALNWDDELTLFNNLGEEIKPERDFQSPVNRDDDNSTITYAETSTSPRNVLKYRNRHVFTFDAQGTFGKFDVGLSVQYRSWMENVDYAFVSETFIGFEPFINTQAFSGVRDYRERFDGRGTTILSARVFYNFSDRARLGVVGDNLLNQFYVDRPGYPGQPINFTARFSYTFNHGKKDDE